ncbi:MAG: lysostaphin resistance A-like protein [Nitrospiraceae bacterium]
MVDLISNPQSSSLSRDEPEPTPSAVYDHHFSPAVTALSALVLLSSVLFIVWLHLSIAPVDRIPSPDRALALMVGRTLELEAALAGAPAWEQWLYDITAETGGQEVSQAITWYEELAASLDRPSVQLELAVLEAEAGRLERIDQKTRAWVHRSDPFPFFARLLRAAYLGPPLNSTDELDLQAELATTLPAGWFYDRLAIALAERAGHHDLLAAARASLAARAGELLWRIRILTALELFLIVVGLIGLLFFINMVSRSYGTHCLVGAARIPPPWPGRIGLAVLVRGGALGLVIALAFMFVNVDDPWIRLSAVPLASLPLLVMSQRYLFQPAGLEFADGLGLRLAPGGWRRLSVAVMALAAGGLLGEWALGMLAEQLNLTIHWAEWFDADLVWGDRLVLGVSLLEFVVFAPIFEEITFRGLLFGSLRRRFGWGTSAVLSATIFASAHGYGLLGFASVLWSGILWAWMYEKTGSLLPGMLAHALNNFLVCVAMIWLLR